MNNKGKNICALYCDSLEFQNDFFNPCFDIKNVISFRVKGKNYRECKNDVREKAFYFQNICEKPNISYFELYLIQNWFFKMGKKYGLLNEFKKNAII